MISPGFLLAVSAAFGILEPPVYTAQTTRLSFYHRGSSRAETPPIPGLRSWSKIWSGGYCYSDSVLPLPRTGSITSSFV